jgi:hypothetical protein
MKTLRALTATYPVGAYFALTFAISWSEFLLVGGRGLLSGTDWQTDPRFPVAVR